MIHHVHLDEIGVFDLLISLTVVVVVVVAGCVLLNFKAAELTQYLKPVGFGPSSKTCPKCDPHLAQDTSVRTRSGLRAKSKRFPPTFDHHHV